MSNRPVYLRDRHWDASGVLDQNLAMTQDAVNARLMAAVGSDSAAAHNAVYRGKNLGTSVTAAQYAAIDAGTFDDLYIGDCWTINGVTWRIAAFDYWLHCGSPLCQTHHAVVVPDTALYVAQMHNTGSGEFVNSAAENPITGAYVGSDMYTANLAQAKTIVNSAFGAEHILHHTEILKSAVEEDGSEGGKVDLESTVELMTEYCVYGSIIIAHTKNGSTLDQPQFPLFALEPARRVAFFNNQRAPWWLRDIGKDPRFCAVNNDGSATSAYSSHKLGVRPMFAICAA